MGYRKEQHSFEDAMYWKVTDERDLVNAHQQRFNRIRNCSKAWDPTLFLAFLTRPVDRDHFPYMRELACRQQLVDHNVTYDAYQMARNNNEQIPSNVDPTSWRMNHCDHFDLSSVFVLSNDGNTSYSSRYYLQGKCDY